MSRSIVALLAALAVGSACHSTDAVSPASVAGSYDLSTVDGLPVPITGAAATAAGVVLSGSISLGADGSATRRITYGAPGVPSGRLYTQQGSFVVRGDTVVLTVQETASNPPVAVRWPAYRSGTTLTLRFGAPADGPDIVEVYARR